jgi:hypothetical protein
MNAKIEATISRETKSEKRIRRKIVSRANPTDTKALVVGDHLGLLVFDSIGRL